MEMDGYIERCTTENYAKVGSKALNIHIVIGMILKTVPSRKEKLLQRDEI